MPELAMAKHRRILKYAAGPAYLQNGIYRANTSAGADQHYRHLMVRMATAAIFTLAVTPNIGRG
jgi:hypothetical protein